MELLIARNPDESSSLPYLLKVPVGGGLVCHRRCSAIGVVRGTST